MSEYSDNERKLFTALSYGKIMDHVDPIPLYKMATETAFINNMTSPAVEALRRAMTVFKKCSMYRHTDEFEKLIEFDE